MTFIFHCILLGSISKDFKFIQITLNIFRIEFSPSVALNTMLGLWAALWLRQLQSSHIQKRPIHSTRIQLRFGQNWVSCSKGCGPFVLTVSLIKIDYHNLGYWLAPNTHNDHAKSHTILTHSTVNSFDPRCLCFCIWHLFLVRPSNY